MIKDEEVAATVAPEVLISLPASAISVTKKDSTNWLYMTIGYI